MACSDGEALLRIPDTPARDALGEPLNRRGVENAMSEQFVTGQTIEEALARSRR